MMVYQMQQYYLMTVMINGNWLADNREQDQ